MADQATVRVNVIVPRELWEAFRQVAEQNFRSRSDHIRFLMAEAVKAADRG